MPRRAGQLIAIFILVKMLDGMRQDAPGYFTDPDACHNTGVQWMAEKDLHRRNGERYGFICEEIS